jgi:hypothetical protein
MCEQLADGAGDALADVRQLLEPFQSTLPKELVQGLAHQANGIGRATIRAHPERVRALISKQVRGFFQAAGDLFVDPLHWRPPDLLKQTALRAAVAAITTGCC